jgi:hypothetical protein
MNNLNHITKIEVYQGYPHENNIEMMPSNVELAYELLPDVYKDAWEEDNIVCLNNSYDSIYFYDSHVHATYVFNLRTVEAGLRDADLREAGLRTKNDDPDF